MVILYYTFWLNGKKLTAKKAAKTSLAETMVRWFEGGVNQGLLPMTISEEESSCHILNCDEDQRQ
jgi:hypothetical protein